MNQVQAAVGTQFVLYRGPKAGTSEFHMQFFTSADQCKEDDSRESGRELLQHPPALTVPLGTVLSFDWLKTRSHDDQGMGCSNYVTFVQIQRVTYTTRNGRFGLLLPRWTKTLQYEGFEPLILEGPETFLPFCGEPHETKMNGGNGRIISLPVSADSPVPA